MPSFSFQATLEYVSHPCYVLSIVGVSGVCGAATGHPGVPGSGSFLGTVGVDAARDGLLQTPVGILT